MRKCPSPPKTQTKDCREFYALVKKFCDIAPWKWIEDVDVFGVEDPNTKQICYCCVMGNSGITHGIAIYRGIKGLNYLEALLSGALTNDDARYEMDALALTFGEKKFLNTHDLKVLEQAGYKPARGFWPSARSHIPGYQPWYLTESEIRFFSSVLKKTMELAIDLQRKPQILSTPKKGQYYVFSTTKGDVWQGEWVTPLRIEKKKRIKYGLDELRIRKIKKHSKGHIKAWEADAFYMPMLIDEGDRPFFSRNAMIADHESGYIVNSNIFRPEDNIVHVVCDLLLNSLEQSRVIPSEIRTRRADIYAALEQLSEPVGFELKLQENLTAIDEARIEMIDHFCPGY